VEPVKVIYSDGKSYVYPDLSVYNMEVPLSYITGSIGVSLAAEKVL
jgi:phenylalanyl-tRNA synthetase beta chain